MVRRTRAVPPFRASRKKSLKTKIDVSAALTSIFFYFLNNFFYLRDGLQRKGEAACSQMVENSAL